MNFKFKFYTYYEYTSVMRVRFTYIFLLDRKFKISILEIQEEIDQSQPLSQQYQSAWTRQWLDQIIILLAMHDLSALLYKA